MRTATLVLGLIAATMLLFSGCTAYVAGGFFGAVEDAFDMEADDPDDITSTSEDIENAGAFAVVVAIFLFVAAGLAKAALKTSLALLLLGFPMLIGLVSVDTTSLFAAFYYLAIVLVGTGIILMAIAYIRFKRTGSSTD